MGRILILGLALAALLGGNPVWAGEEEEAAWKARIEVTLERAEAQCSSVDGKRADEDATLPERLTALNERLEAIEKELDLPDRRFWLYDGTDSIRLLSSWSQMAASLASRASLAAHAHRRNLVEDATRNARKAREARERAERAARDAAAREAEANGETKTDRKTGGSRRAGTSRPGMNTGTGSPRDREPRIVMGKVKKRTTMTMINVPLAKDMRGEFTIFFDPPTAGDTKKPSSPLAPSGTTNGGMSPTAPNNGKPDPVMGMLIVAKPEDVPLPRKGKVEFRTGEGESERKIAGEYVESRARAALLGTKSKTQLLRGEICGPDFEAIVNVEGECITVVDGTVHTTEVCITGKAFELLKQLLSVYDEAASCPPEGECPAPNPTEGRAPAAPVNPGNGG